MDNRPDGADAIGTIELELVKLVRHLETFGRRSSLYVRVDRAGYLAMRVLEDLGPLSTNALAHALHLDASTVTRQIAPLERGALIERRRDPADGRTHLRFTFCKKETTLQAAAERLAKLRPRG